MRRINIFAILCGVGLMLLGTACSSEDSPKGEGGKTPQVGVGEIVKPLTPDGKMRAWIEGQTASGLEAFQLIEGVKNKENVVFAPYSFNTLLAMLANGADASNEQLLLDFLHSTDVESLNDYNATLHANFPHLDSEVTLMPVNSVWYNVAGVGAAHANIPFAKVMADKYQADLFFKGGADMADDVNDWVSGKTNGLIPQLLEPGEKCEYAVALLNAFYFSGAWSETFDASKSTNGDFRNADGTLASVTMMNGERMTARYLATEEAQSIVMPFGDGHYTITLVLPTEGMSLSDFVAGLTPDHLKSYQRGQVEGVDVTIPKFDISSKLDLYDLLFAAGIGDRLSRGDWSKIGIENTLLTKMLQRTAFSLTEKGGTGAGVSAGFLEFGAAGPEGPGAAELHSFTADRPFLFVITEVACGMPILVGTVNHL